MTHCARTRRALPFLVAALVTVLLVRPAIAQDDGWHTIEIETTEVTAPDVAITPDGEWLIFTLLGCYQVRPNLRIVGDYRRVCGGAEGMRDAEIDRVVREYARHGSVIFEGFIVSTTVSRWLQLAEDVDKVTFAFLTTPVDVCINRVLGRRAVAGNTKPYNPRRVIEIQRVLALHYRKFEAVGARCVWLPWEEPLPALEALLNGAALGKAFAQRAWVEGFARRKTALALAEKALYTDLFIAVFEPSIDTGYQIPITVADGHPYTWAGTPCWEDLDHFAEACNARAMRTLRTAWYVVAIDLSWGRKDHLWETLLQPNRPDYDVRPHPELELDHDFHY